MLCLVVFFNWYAQHYDRYSKRRIITDRFLSGGVFDICRCAASAWFAGGAFPEWALLLARWIWNGAFYILG